MEADASISEIRSTTLGLDSVAPIADLSFILSFNLSFNTPYFKI